MSIKRDYINKGSLWCVRLFRELICRYVYRTRSGLIIADFQANAKVRDAIKAKNENTRMSPETNPPPPNIIRAFDNTPERKINMFIIKGGDFFVFMNSKIKLNYR